MAKTKKAPTPVMIAAEAAREAYKTANDAWDAASKNDDGTPKGKAAEAAKAKRDEAKAARDAAEKAENRERFKTLGGGRVNRAVAGVKLLSNIANLRMYDFTQADVDKITTALDAAVKGVKTAFTEALSPTGKAAKVKEQITFE